MPSSSEKQARTMAAAAHDPEFARRMGIPQSVARDYNDADEGSSLLKDAMKHRKKRKVNASDTRGTVRG